MRRFSLRSSAAALLCMSASLTLASTPAAAQESTVPNTRPIGETYRIEVAGGMWQPTVSGIISSEQFGIPGSAIDFVSDLGFTTTRFTDGRLVLRPAKKHKFRVQYVPVSYSAESKLTRSLVFNGLTYAVNLPVNSTFDWKVWRFGYEYDVIYTDRGYLGIILEGRYTEMNASLVSPINSEYTRAKAPLPAAGAVIRLYPIRNVSITGEITGFKLPDIGEDYEANYADIDVYATINLMNNVGVQGGWRRMNSFLRVETDQGDVKFQGGWVGVVIRY